MTGGSCVGLGGGDTQLKEVMTGWEMMSGWARQFRLAEVMPFGLKEADVGWRR